MPYPAEHSARIHNPGRYVRIRRQNDEFGPGIDVLWGVPKEGATEVQAIRFDAARFTPEQARAWLREHDYTPIEFSAATGLPTGQTKKQIHVSQIAEHIGGVTEGSLTNVHARAHEMLGQKTVSIAQILHLHSACVGEMARRGIPHDTPIDVAAQRGLYMTYPHGDLTYQGKKKALARSNGRSLAGRWVVVSNGMAYGMVTVGEPEAMNVAMFDARFTEHRVTVKERQKWWADRKRLWLSCFLDFVPYDTPRPVIVPQGTSLIMDRVVFADGQKGGPGPGRHDLPSETPAEEEQPTYPGEAVVRPLEAYQRRRHAVAEKVGADELETRDLGQVVIEAGGHSFAGKATVTAYKTRSTGRVWYRYDVEFTPPIHIEGKGENSWDCGDDHTYSISVPLDTDDEPGYKAARARVAESIPLDRLIVDEKGGSGSGHHGHRGREGQVGGSLPRGAAGGSAQEKLTFAVLQDVELTDDQYDQYLSWEGARGTAAEMALVAYDEGYTLVLGSEGKEYIGIASLDEGWEDPFNELEGQYVNVDWLGTKRAGYGRQMVDRIAAYAGELGQGVYFGADPSAVGFYEKLGMRHTGKNIYYWTPDDVRERTKALDDLSDLEPESGVFTIGQDWTKRAAEKGGPGSGNWGHTSRTRIGQVGGSDPGGGLARIGAEPSWPAETRRRMAREHRQHRAALPSLPQTVADETYRAIREVFSRGWSTGKEHGYAVDGQGNKINGSIGGEAKSSLNVGIVRQGAGPGSVLIHNHPKSGSFSPEDVSQITSGPFDHILAVGHNGTIYRLSRTELTPTAQQLSHSFGDVPLDPRSEEIVRTATVNDRAFWMVDYQWEEFHDTRYDMFAREVAAGRISNREANVQHQHLTIQDLAGRFALDYVKIEPPWEK